MILLGDLIELNPNGSNRDVLNENPEHVLNIPWEIHEGIKLPHETYSLYSTNLEKVEIHELPNNVFDVIENSSFSHVYTHIYSKDKLFIIFFEFAIEKDPNEFEFGHFGIVPANDFIDTLKINPTIKIRDKTFQITQTALDKILERITEFKMRFPDNALL